MWNPINVLNLAKMKYEERGFQSTSPTSPEDLHMCNLILNFLDIHSNDINISLETVETLEEIGHSSDESMNCSSDDDSCANASSEEEYIPSPNKTCTSIPVSDKEQAVKFWLNEGGRKRLKLSSVQSRFRFVKSERELYKWKKELLEVRNMRQNSTRESLKGKLFERFKTARDRQNTVTDGDLRDWAIRIASEMKIADFQASSTWLSRFKKSYRIRSRKITTFTSKNRVQQLPLTENIIGKFIADVKTKLAVIPTTAVYNADQSGFVKELRAHRTLSFRGEKKTESVAQSMNAMTHSYTIMPVISMSGVLFPQLYICLQEHQGKLGPKIKKELFSCKNLVIDASKSGKMGKNNFQYFIRNVFLPAAETNSLLLLDSWSGHNDTSAFLENDEKVVDIIRIPPGTTSVIQPLDKEFFRQWKSFFRKLSDNIISDTSLSFQVYQRNSILKLQSFVHYQFTSPRFKNLIKYAWYAAQYTEQRPGTFFTPSQFCLNKTSTYCEVPECANFSFVRCAWCKENICFSHSVDTSHFCDDYRE